MMDDHLRPLHHPYVAFSTSAPQRNYNKTDHLKLYSSWRPFLIIVKILGMFPLPNVASLCGPQQSSFRPCSLHALYSGTFLIIVITVTIFNFGYYFSSFDPSDLRLMFRNLSVPMYTLAATMTAVAMMVLTSQLPMLFTQWDGVCNRLRKYCLKRDDRPFLNPTTVALVTLFAYFTTAFHTCYRHFLRCIPEDYYSTAHYLLYNLHNCVPYMEYALGSSLPSAIVAYGAIILVPLMWNVRDITIILCSLTFQQNFKIIPKYLEDIQQSNKRNLTRRQWRTIREDHRAICNMVKVVDGHLCPLLLLSFTFNLYHILLDLYTFFTLTHVTMPMTIFRSFSVIYFSSRLASVTLTAVSFSRIATEPIKYMNRCSSHGYTEEIVGIVVTYELIILGF